MVFFQRDVYHQTIDVLRGRKELSPLFKELKELIQSKYGATAYNFSLKKTTNKKLPEVHFSLEVVFAATDDFNKILSPRNDHEYVFDENIPKEEIERILATCKRITNGYDKSIQKEIAKIFFELAKNSLGEMKSSEEIWVWYTNFSERMKSEINRKIAKIALKSIIQKYAAYRIWSVIKSFNSSVVFFLSEEDLENSTDIRTEMEDYYFGLLKQHDEFNVYDRTDFRLQFDSKQNLDENYEGSLHYYFK